MRFILSERDESFAITKDIIIMRGFFFLVKNGMIVKISDCKQHFQKYLK